MASIWSIMTLFHMVKSEQVCGLSSALGKFTNPISSMIVGMVWHARWSFLEVLIVVEFKNFSYILHKASDIVGLSRLSEHQMDLFLPVRCWSYRGLQILSDLPPQWGLGPIPATQARAKLILVKHVMQLDLEGKCCNRAMQWLLVEKNKVVVWLILLLSKE